MQIYQDLLGLTFSQIKNPPSVWYKDVTMYEVKDSATKKLLGHFYLDLYPRPDKFNHAACFTISKRNRYSATKTQTAVAAMVTNLTPPTATEPSLLSHENVVTFFHEFGHVMHNMCNEANYTKFAGAQVEQDFVEMPSQMLENWIW
jgi:Zn-dependent oligopeptidase